MSTFRSSITSVSWIPSEAIPTVLMKIPVLLGIAHYDPVPPDHLEDLEKMHAEGRFRFANQLRAWIETDGDQIVDAGYDGCGLISKTVADLKLTSFAFNPVEYPLIQKAPEYGDGWVRFAQTYGGRTGAPMPRKISRPPFVQVVAPVVWTTLSLTLHADGRAEYGIVGASPFPRHWFYDDDGNLVKKSGIADYKNWADSMEESSSPWGEKEHELLVSDAESQLERQMSATIMQQGKRPEFRRLDPGQTLTEEGAQGSKLYLVLDGMLIVEVGGEPIAEVGPGSILGERAIVEGGRRTATLRAATPVRIAVAPADQVDREALAELASTRRREEHTSPAEA